MISENKQSAVKKALQSAFGVNEFDDIQQLTKGLSSALVFKIMVRGNPYLLRVITRADAMGDPAFYYNCMQVAAGENLAPPIYYLNVEDRVSITGFITEQPFPITEAREKLAKLLQQLHSLPKFPYRINYFTSMEGFMKKFQASNILPESATKDIFELYERIAIVYPRNDQENWVSCHNDLKPENIIFDGVRPWPVDWEAAFLNDRYLDLAVVANFVVTNYDDEIDFLERYFGEAVSEYRHARFFVMQQILHIYAFTFFILVASAGQPIELDKIDSPDFRTFHDQIWNGEIDLSNNEAKLRYARVHMEQALHNSQTKRFNDSLPILSGHAKLHSAEAH
jgi:thiamine kinase-like enzyme